MREVTQYPRRTERRNQINRRLAAAAVRLFERQGYARTKLAEVAEEADVHVQTLYKHFKTKEELARAAAAVSIEDCRAHFERAPKDQSTFQVGESGSAKTCIDGARGQATASWPLPTPATKIYLPNSSPEISRWLPSDPRYLEWPPVCCGPAMKPQLKCARDRTAKTHPYRIPIDWFENASP